MSEEKLGRIIELLEEILKWTRFEGNQRVKEVLLDELNTDAKKIVYELSDGTSSPKIRSMIKETVDVNERTIREWWKKWSNRGLTEIHPNFQKRYRKVFSLGEFGIEVPGIKKVKETAELAEEAEVEEE